MNKLKYIVSLMTIFVMLSMVSCDGVFGDDKDNPKKDYLITITTDKGVMHAILYDETPLHKKNFIELAKKGLYDSTIFHRVIDQFMVQGGDIQALHPEDSSFNKRELIPAEFVKHRFHKKGTLAAARTNNPEKKSSWCQFYISQGKVYDEVELSLDQDKLRQALPIFMQDTIKNMVHIDSINAYYEQQNYEKYIGYISQCIPLIEEQAKMSLRKDIPEDRLKAYTTIGGIPHLDDAYTVFGEVIDGIDVIDKIAKVETDPGNKPVEDVKITVTVEYLPKKKITKMYGYQYPPKARKNKKKK